RAEVDAVSLAHHRIAGATCNRDGEFTIGLVDPQPLRLQVSIDEFDRWVGSDSFETATTFDPQPGTQIRGVAIVEGGITCQIDYPGSPAPGNARATLFDSTGRSQVANAFSNPIRFFNLRSGSYRLYVHDDCFGAASWASQWYDGADSPASATAIVVVA